jgi:hypothetical protein
VVRGSRFTVHGLRFAVCAYIEAEKRNQTQGLLRWFMARGGRSGVNCGLSGVEQMGLMRLMRLMGAPVARVIVFVGGLGANGEGLGRPDA